MLPYNYGITNGGDHLPLIHVHSTKGDLNSDGTLTPADAAIALEIASGSRPCDAATLAAADVSSDNRVTSLGALMILQASNGVIDLWGPPALTTADAAVALQIAAGSRGYNPRWNVSGDGRVTSLDALMILQAAAGSIEI